MNGIIINIHGVLKGTSSRNGGFSIARFDYQRLPWLPANRTQGSFSREFKWWPVTARTLISRFWQVQFRNALQQQSALQRFGRLHGLSQKWGIRPTGNLTESIILLRKTRFWTIKFMTNSAEQCFDDLGGSLGSRPVWSGDGWVSLECQCLRHSSSTIRLSLSGMQTIKDIKTNSNDGNVQAG